EGELELHHRTSPAEELSAKDRNHSVAKLYANATVRMQFRRARFAFQSCRLSMRQPPGRTLSAQEDWLQVPCYQGHKSCLQDYWEKHPKELRGIDKPKRNAILETSKVVGT